MADKSITFGECAELVRDTINPSEATGMPYIGLEHIEVGTLKLSGHGNATDVKSNKYRFQKGDILFGKLRPYFRKVIVAPFDGVCSTDIWVVRANPNTEQGYLYYWMASQDFVDFATNGSEGTRMPRAKWEYVSRYKQIKIPLKEQKAIAHVLGTMDDKIELNQQMNETLESIAQAIFKSWFVDFDPVRAKAEGRDTGLPKEIAALFPDSFEDSVLGEIPKGWEVKTIGEVVRAVGGGTPSTKEPPYWLDGTYSFATPKDLSKISSCFLMETEKKVTEKGLCKISSGLLPEGTILLSSRAPVGYLAISNIPISVNQGFIAMVCEESVSNYYILNWTRFNMDEIKQRASGTTFPEISKKNFRPIPIIVPGLKIIERFTEFVKPIYESISNNLLENLNLTRQRDILLPKLISGELRVPEAEYFIKEVII